MTARVGIYTRPPKFPYRGPAARIARLLDSVGDGSGTTLIKGVYTAGVGDGVFMIKPAAGEIFAIARLIGMYTMSGVWTAEKFGSLTALANGCLVQVLDSEEPPNVVCDLTAGLPVTHNASWKQHCYDSATETIGSGNTSLAFRWTFTKAGDYIHLKGDAGHRLAVIAQDDLSAAAVVEHYMKVEGWQTK